MPNLFLTTAKKTFENSEMSDTDAFSLIYHNIFDYPLTFAELIKWNAGKLPNSFDRQLEFSNKNGYFFVEGREGIIYQRLLRQRISGKKLEIAKRASKIISFVPTVKMVGVTGSLSMANSLDESDIDLMIITKGGNLWTTRLVILGLLSLFNFPTRRSGDHNQKDKLCLNMWLDENDLTWNKNDRNFYTAHEIAQVLPLVDKGQTYEKFLAKNKWILNFWPNSLRINNLKVGEKKINPNLLEKICFKIQYQHMRAKISREVITSTRALFHPQDWGKVILDRIS